MRELLNPRLLFIFSSFAIYSQGLRVDSPIFSRWLYKPRFTYPSRIIAFVFLILYSSPSNAEVKLPGIFGNNMVLQREVRDRFEKLKIEMRRRSRHKKTHSSWLLTIALCVWVGSPILSQEVSPLHELPPHIRKVTHFGQRADWSHDGKRILFLEKTFGDVFEVDLETQQIRPLTHHYDHEGYVRALYLVNGDILLAGARRFDSENPVPSRKDSAELFVLNKKLSSPPVPLKELCYEGPAVSRKEMKVAWTVRGDKPDAAFYLADIVYEEGSPKLRNKKRILDKTGLGQYFDIETQNFRPPAEKEMIFSGYLPKYSACEVLGLKFTTGEIINYSKNPDLYNEPEGIFPDGKFTLMESDQHNAKGTGNIDIYKLALDGSGSSERLTFFSNYPGYKSSNPVVSDDGNFMAFQVAKSNDWAGVGRGILIYNLNKNDQFPIGENEAQKKQASSRPATPYDELPPYIKPLTNFGQRADWSHDGKRILFIEKTSGDVYELEIATGIIRPMTHHYYHEGYTRGLYLSNGDILLSGARKFDSRNPWASRSEENAELWILKKDLSGPPIPLGEKCMEGPAVSRTHMKIAWTLGGWQDEGSFYLADIVYEDGVPQLANKKTILNKSDLPFKTSFETQNFRPPDDKELIFSAYGHQGTEVVGLNIETGEIINYSKAPGQYDEPEGIFPDGKYTLVECDQHNTSGKEWDFFIDIYKLALDGSGNTERLTNFADYPGYKSSNPVVSDDGRFIAFQLGQTGDQAGVGHGLLLFDLELYEKMKAEVK